MKKRNVKIKKRRLISLLGVLFLMVIITTTIIKVNKYILESVAQTETTLSDNGYGTITIKYHSNYVGGKTQETYEEVCPIALDTNGKYYITAGEDKFDEEIIINKETTTAEETTASEGETTAVAEETTTVAEENITGYTNTGFRGYTLTANTSGVFWDDSNTEAIYMQGYKMYLEDLGVSAGESKDIYAQWQEATVVYTLYNTTITDTILDTYNSKSTYNPLYEYYKKDDVSTWFFTTENLVNIGTNAGTDAVGSIYEKFQDGTINTNYIVIINKGNFASQVWPKGDATITGKYNGITYMDTTSTNTNANFINLRQVTLRGNFRMRNIRTFCTGAVGSFDGELIYGSRVEFVYRLWCG